MFFYLLPYSHSFSMGSININHLLLTVSYSLGQTILNSFLEFARYVMQI